MSTTRKIRLTKRGVLQRRHAGNSETIVAPPIRLVARGQRLSDGGYIARFRFQEMNGGDKSVYVEWALILPEKNVN